ncbi:NmrA family transcriptional regulator [Actinoplanes sp. NPDC049668]|uniref:NmrA family transcriptional regulator n=1 Tax=unclassified Actinoplanes TaxID=2626549 RepID=UPI0033BD0EC2
MTVTFIAGGAGKTGGRVADRLHTLGLEYRLASRSTRPRFDWTDDTTWAPALAGCGRAYLAFQPDVGIPGAAETIGALARAAVTAGCTRLVLLSGRGEQGAQRSEEALAASGADWTVVRAAFFAQNFTEGFWADQMADGSLAMLDHRAAEPFVDADDIADVVVACLTRPGHGGVVHELTGPRLLTFADAVAEIGRLTGRPISYRPLPAAEFTATLVDAGWPAGDADGLTALFGEVLDGRNAHVTDGVRRVLGRAPRDLTDVLPARHP